MEVAPFYTVVLYHMGISMYVRNVQKVRGVEEVILHHGNSAISVMYQEIWGKGYTFPHRVTALFYTVKGEANYRDYIEADIL